MIKTIKNFNLLIDCYISGRNLYDLAFIKRNNNKRYVSYNITEGRSLKLKDFIKQGKIRSLHFTPNLISLDSKLITQEFTDACHKNEIFVLSWNFIGYKNPLNIIKSSVDKGIDGILFDNNKNLRFTKLWLEVINRIS